jgi:hypothetical protein
MLYLLVGRGGMLRIDKKEVEPGCRKYEWKFRFEASAQRSPVHHASAFEPFLNRIFLQCNVS